LVFDFVEPEVVFGVVGWGHHHCKIYVSFEVDFLILGLNKEHVVNKVSYSHLLIVEVKLFSVANEDWPGNVWDLVEGLVNIPYNISDFEVN
jgi:hypothetical protein